MATSAPSTEAKDLALIGKVELRIALTDSDDKLEKTLNTYLAPLLLKLASPHPAVRNKIISICSHVNTRIKPETIKLPVQALVEQFRAQIDVPLIRHFDLLYIHKGVPRLNAVEKGELFPVIVKGIASTSQTSTEHASQVLNLIFQLLEHFKFSSRGTEQDALLRKQLELSDEDAAYLAKWFSRLILFTPVKAAAGQKKSCPGLTADEYSFLALQDKDDTWTAGSGSGLNLTQTKARAARLLASGLFTDEERFFPALFASADLASVVSGVGDDMLKRVIPSTDFEDDKLIRELYTYFFGTEGANGRQRARAPLRLKILGYLSKSLASTTFTKEIVDMVDEGLSNPAINNNPDAMQIDSPSHFSSVQQISSVLSAAQSSRATGGLETAKLRGALFSYINFVARHGRQDALHTIAPRVLTRLRDFVEEQGWPRAASATTQQELESRGYAYEVIGLLGKAGPDSLVVEPNLDILRWLFRSLAEDRSSNTLTVSIEEALSTLLTALSRSELDAGMVQALETLLLEQMAQSAEAQKDPESNRRSTRYVAVRFANRCLPFSSVRARGVDLLAVGAGNNERNEVIEEGQRGLSPYWYRMLNGSLAETEALTFPRFLDVMHFVFYELSCGGKTVSDELDMSELVDHLRAAAPGIFADALQFCRLILFNEVLTEAGHGKIAVDSDWERKLNVAVDTDDKTRKALVQGFGRILASDETESAKAIELLLRGYTHTLIAKEPLPPSASASEVTKHLVDLCSLLPDALIGEIALQYPLLVPSILSNNHDLRQSSARVFGLLVSHSVAQSHSKAEIDRIILGMVERISKYKSAVGAVVNQIHGCTLAVAYYFTRLKVRGVSVSEETQSSMKTYLEDLKEMLLTSTSDDLVKVALRSLSELCLYQVITPHTYDTPKALLNIIDRVADVAKKGDEQAALALGRISTILPEPSSVDEQVLVNASKDASKDAGKDASKEAAKDQTENSTPSKETGVDDNALLLFIVARLHKLHEIRTAESHFAIGEALSTLAASWSSSALATAIDVTGTLPPPHPKRESRLLAALLARTLTDCSTTKPSLRKASVMWLLCLVQFTGHLPPVQTRLADCQNAFKRCLADRDELVQETASRGLGLVYKAGDAGLRRELVRDLMAGFSAERRTASATAGSVGADTQLFEPGAMPTGDGGSVSTYGDIMRLAAEVGDSSLVYRFMGLASSNAVWSSRAAFGRFGLGEALLGGDGNGVEDYLKENPKVYVSLYRYRFDPIEGVRRSMNGIWNSLVKDGGKVVDAHFDAIVEDLLSNILGREWRTRQACCAALADLVQGRSIDKYEPYLERIWNACFKVLDDIKESVRAAAASLARTLTGILTRTLEADDSGSNSKNSQAMLGHVLPFLLSPSGLESSAQEVQLFAVRALLDIVKKSSGKALRPFIPELVERLLALMGSLEPEAVEYVRLNAKKYDVTEQRIDDMRLSSVRASPVMEAVERCLDLLDGETMALLVPRLESAMRAAIALPSKVGCSRVLVSLATRHAFLFAGPHADGMLKALERAVLDRNDTVASSYAAAAGYVARGASDAQVLRLVGFARKLYFDSEGDRDAAVPRRAVTSGDLVAAVSKHAADRFKSLATSLLPFVFVAKHDGHAGVKSSFEETWNEHVGGGSRAVLLYLDEIVALSDGYIDSPQWAVKHTVARAIAATSVSLGAAGMDGKSAGVIWPRLEKALAAKTWEGKEKVLDGFVSFVEKGESFWQARDDVKASIVKIAVREAKRQNIGYRKFALPCLGKVAAARSDMDMSEAVYGVVQPVLDEALDKCREDKETMDVDGDKSGDVKAWQAVIAAGVQALSLSVSGRGPVGTGSVERVLQCYVAVVAAKQSGADVGVMGIKEAIAKLEGAGAISEQGPSREMLTELKKKL